MRTGNLDLMKGARVKNFSPENLATDPDVGSFVANQESVLWWNTTEKKYKYFDGTVIKALGESNTLPEGIILADGSVPMEADLILSGPDQSASADNAAVSKKHVETALAAKQDALSGLTENGVVVAGPDNTLVTSTTTAAQLGYLSGVTSPIQTQIGTINTNVQNLTDDVNGKLDEANGQLSGDLDANGNTITNLAAPIAANDAARKIDIDNALAGLDWQHDVNAVQADGTLDPELVEGRRYLILDADTVNPNFGTIAGLTDGMIVEYVGAAFVIKFDPTQPGAGGAVTWDLDSKTYRRFDGTTWGIFGGVSEFNAGAGLEQVGNVVNVKAGDGIALDNNAVNVALDTNSGLEFNAGKARVKLSGGTLSRTVDGISVTAGGIGYTQIAAAALGVGLTQDEDTSTIIVDVAAVKTAGGFIDAAGGAVSALTLTEVDPTYTDASVVTKKYIDDAIAAGSGAGAAKLYLFDKTGAGDAAATTHTFEHSAGVRFGSVTVVDDTGYQIIPNEIVFVDANTLRVELTEAKKVAIAFVTGANAFIE